MTVAIELQESAFVFVGKKQNPSLINPDFFRCSGIIREDLELARPPVYTQQAAQLVFTNGVSVTAQADRVIFAESMATKSLQELEVPQIARKYIEALPHAEYQMMGINLRGLVPFPQTVDAARQFLTRQLLSAGAWQDFGEEPARTSLNVAYTLQGRRLYLSINEAALQLPDEQVTPIVLFSGNFEYSVEGDRQRLLSVLSNWQADLEIYKNLINDRFLNSKPMPFSISTLQPELIPMSA